MEAHFSHIRKKNALVNLYYIKSQNYDTPRQLCHQNDNYDFSSHKYDLCHILDFLCHYDLQTHVFFFVFVFLNGGNGLPWNLQFVFQCFCVRIHNICVA